MHFGAGVRPDIGKVILAQAAPPASIEGMLAAEEAVEAEQAKKGAPGASALAVAEQAPSDVAADTVAPSFDFAQLQNQVSELTQIVSAIAFKSSATAVVNLDTFRIGAQLNNGTTPVLTADSHDKLADRGETRFVVPLELNIILSPIKTNPSPTTKMKDKTPLQKTFKDEGK